MNRHKQSLLILRMFRPETHSIEIRHSTAREWLIQSGYLKWVPTIFGSNNQYSITEEGLKYRDEYKQV